MMKVKGYWPLASTDEPQVLALAELLQDAKISRESDVLLGVTALAKTESGKRNEFRPTPAMVADMAVAMRRERHQRERSQVPSGINPDGTWYDGETGRLAEEFDPSTGEVKTKMVASPEARDRAMAQMRHFLSSQPKVRDEILSQFSTPEIQGDHADDVTREDARSDIGGFGYTVAYAERLATDSRKVGIPDTEDEIIQFRWTFEPPGHWKMQATCGPWVNSQSQAMQDGRTWLAQINRRHP